MDYLKSVSEFFSFLLMLILFNFIPSTTFAQDHATEIDKLIGTFYEQGKFHGTALVADNGKIIYKKGFGHANIEWDIPNTPDTKFRIGSITKQFTSMLILQLMEGGKISLKEKLSTYLPYYRKDIGEKVTIHQLLTHTSGIPSYTSQPDFFQEVSRDKYGVREFVEKYCSKDLEFEPGSQFRYNNSGYFILGAVIEEVTGLSYEDALEKMILEPLEMKNSGYDLHAPILPKRARGYEKSAGGYVNAPFLDMSLPYAAGSIYSTVEDLYLWDQALYSTKLISEKSKSLLFDTHVAAFGAHYGYGWRILDTTLPGGKTINIVEHGGGINGFNTLITRIVSDKDLILLFNNTGGAPLNQISQGISRILNDLPYELPKLNIGDVISKKVGEQSYNDIRKVYDEINKKHPGEYDQNPGTLNTLGYQLLAAGRLDDAIEVFKLNIDLYPEESNPYDSLGEAYMKKGEREKAIINYAKSLELNPKNDNAIKMMHKMLDDGNP